MGLIARLADGVEHELVEAVVVVEILQSLSELVFPGVAPSFFHDSFKEEP